MTFFERLEARARKLGGAVCVGLDPHPEFLAADSAEAGLAWCTRMIEATAEVACAYKPNAAFFERWGAPGWETLRQVIAAAGRRAPVLLDAKRGDIASSARAYAQAVFDGLGAEAVTASPYLGRDALEPFLEAPGRGVFLLCKTSNAGSQDVQTLTLADGRPLYLEVARRAAEWNTREIGRAHV